MRPMTTSGTASACTVGPAEPGKPTGPSAVTALAARASARSALIVTSPSPITTLCASSGTHDSNARLHHAGTTPVAVNDEVSTVKRRVRGLTMSAPVTLIAIGVVASCSPSTTSPVPIEVSDRLTRAGADNAPAGPSTVTDSNSATNDPLSGIAAGLPSVGTSTAGALCCSARHKNVAIWALVVTRPGQKSVPSPQPAVMPDSASLATSVAYHASAGTSPNPGSGPSGRL